MDSEAPENERIYVRVIDGIMSMVEVASREVKSYQFEILDDPTFHRTHPGTLFEFYPGDIVRVEDTEDMDNEYLYEAKEIVRRSEHPDRLYLEIQFRFVTGFLGAIEHEYPLFKEAIERIKRESSAGKFFYPRILEELPYLERRMANSK